MSNRRKLKRVRVDSIKVVCRRCGKVGGMTSPGWNGTWVQGVLLRDGFTCPGCQTPDENAEAVINEATLDYDYVAGVAYPKEGL